MLYLRRVSEKKNYNLFFIIGTINLNNGVYFRAASISNFFTGRYPVFVHHRYPRYYYTDHTVFSVITESPYTGSLEKHKIPPALICIGATV